MTEPGERSVPVRGGAGSSADPGTGTKRLSAGSFRQFIRFLWVGAGNTAFGFATYALITFLLEGLLPFHYVAASLLSSVLNVTFSYLAYKWFVFRTRGDYLAEWVRALLVYGATILIGAASLPALVFVSARFLPRPELAPYFAGACLIAAQASLSFIAHRRFTFRGGKH